MLKKTSPARVKTAARVDAPQTRDEVATHIARIGYLQRELMRTEAEMNDRISTVTQQYQPMVDDYKARIAELQKGVQGWCEAHRAELTDSGRVKTANLVTGEVAWRQRPPSCVIRGVESVIDTLKRLSLERFVRVKEEVNKEAILNEPAALRGVAGITLVTGVEDFIVTPFEQTVGAAS